MKVVMASNNAHKIAELRAILSAYGLDVVSQREAPEGLNFISLITQQ